jgi:hypothetical protein
MTQTQLQTLHNMAQTQINLYVNELITLPEFAKSLSDILAAISDTTGLIDPNSGLRL